MSALSVAQVAELKEQLLQAQAAIKEAQGEQSRVDRAHDMIQQRGSVERQHSSDREVDLALSDQSVVELARIEAALAKIETSGYGECDECGVDIPYARLKIEPATQHCVDCKSRWERETGAVPASNM